MTNLKALRVGIIGAGHISEFHMRALSRVAFARVVCIVDSDRYRAEKLSERWGVEQVLAQTSELSGGEMDVLHVLTPPSSHASLTLEGLARGCHVYVEKPLATSAEDCDRIIVASRKAERSVCVGHSFLRDPTYIRARRLVESGAIGEPLSVQYVRSTAYPKYRGGPLPEMYRQGGYPFRDMGVHGLYIIESILGPVLDAKPSIASTGRDPCLHCDEWTVLLNCQRGQAVVHLSWNIRPQQHAVIVQGTRGVLRADLYAMYVSLKRSRRIPEHGARIVNSLAEARQMVAGTLTGLAGFATRRVRQYHGIQNLVEEYYSALRDGRPAPVTPEQSRSVIAWTESIAREGDCAKRHYLAASCPEPKALTLVTGGTGLIGRCLVQRLLAEGRRIRMLVRRIPSNVELARNPNVEFILGDLGDENAVDRAVAGATCVFHLGAALRGTKEEFDRGTVTGTRNAVRAAVRHKLSQFIYVSSLSVLHTLAGNSESLITEDWPLEPRADLRGHYSRTKLEAEQLVRDAVRDDGLPAVILRPAEVLEAGGPRLTAGIALRFGNTLAVLGDGNMPVPMVYVEDLVDALLEVERQEISDGSVFHVVDPVQLTQNSLLELSLAKCGEHLRVIHIPRWCVALAGSMGDVLSALTRRRLPKVHYRLKSALAVRRFDSSFTARRLGWKPRVGVGSALNGGTRSLPGSSPGVPEPVAPQIKASAVLIGDGVSSA